MKKLYGLILILVVLFTFNNSVYATELIRSEDNNYGVNKKWEITDSNKSNVLNTPYVDASEKIYDYADILTDEEEEELYSLIINFISKYNTELVIYTVNTKYTNDYYNETLASDFYDYNDFGLDYELYDGIVLYRNAYSSDPYYDIYTFGNAQLYFGQNRYDTMLDGIYYYISNGVYLTGFTKWIDYVEKDYTMGVDPVYKYYYVDDMGYLTKKFVPNLLFLFGLPIVITVIIISILVSKNKMVKKEFRADTYLDSGSINIARKEDVYLRSHTTSYRISSDYGGSGGHSGGGGHSHSGSSGGGHSSGGGRHG